MKFMETMQLIGKVLTVLIVLAVFASLAYATIFTVSG